MIEQSGDRFRDGGEQEAVIDDNYFCRAVAR